MSTQLQSKRPSWVPLAAIGCLGLAVVCGAALTSNTTDTAAQSSVNYSAGATGRAGVMNYLTTVHSFGPNFTKTLSAISADCGAAYDGECRRDLVAARGQIADMTKTLGHMTVDACMQPTYRMFNTSLSLVDEGFALMIEAVETQNPKYGYEGLAKVKQADFSADADQLRQDTQVCKAKFDMADIKG